MLRLAILGRPNVGKSTLFNALVGKRLALVHDAPGVTRDWREAEADLFGDGFIAIDTAGMEDAPAGTVTAAMRAGTLSALEAADVALFLIDARAGVTAADRDLATLLRRAKKPVLLGAAKAENPRAVAAHLAEAHALGLGEPIALSAAHSLGLDALHAALLPYFEEAEPPVGEVSEENAAPLGDIDALEGLEDYAFPEAPERPVKLAIVGRPNVGKSTLLNALIGQARALTGPEAGVTRDSVEVHWGA
jgi:GTP-binding protein